MAMNSEVKEKWVAALKSGEYKQTQYALHDNEGFCCLGVLCDLYSKEFSEVTWEFDDKLKMYVFQRERTELPSCVSVWAGINTLHGNAAVTFRDEDCQNGERATNLMDLNDEWLMSFDKIADIIQEQL
jgi:hypothetical protein